jgi:hypothetical protein
MTGIAARLALRCRLLRLPKYMTELQFKVSSLIPTLLRVREERVMNYEKINKSGLAYA